MYADIVEALNNANDETIDYIRLKLERTKFRPQEFIGCNIVDQHTNIQLFSRGGVLPKWKCRRNDCFPIR